MIYGYCRVSTKGQASYGNSLEEQQTAILSKYPNAKIITESYSAFKEARPIFDKLVQSMKDGDLLVCTKLDRYCRNAELGLRTLRTIISKNCSLHILNLGLFENTIQGKLQFTMFEAFAEFERGMIVERTQAGKAYAKANNPNYKEGRPKKEVKNFTSYYKKVTNGEMSVKEAIGFLGISRSSWYNLCRELV